MLDSEIQDMFQCVCVCPVCETSILRASVAMPGESDDK